jgi:hypothetical protein
MITVAELVERMKADIVADVKAGIVPRSVASFSDLHDFVDANCYGQADELFGEIVTESATDQEHQAKLDIVNSVTTPAIEIVDAWIKAGGIDTALTLARIGANPKSMTKVTVYRPKERVGLGPPKAFLGDDHSKHGDWVQSAKAELSNDEHPPRLLMLGRAFLIYSMYHAREPRFLGYAVENFGVACQKLGYILPLKETDASWLTYGPEGLDPGRPEDYQHMLGHIATVFGTDAAKQQADALGINRPARANLERGGPCLG